MGCGRNCLASLAVVCLLAGCSSRGASRTCVPMVGDTAVYATTGEVLDVRSVGQRSVTVARGVNHGRSVPSRITATFDVTGVWFEAVGVLAVAKMSIDWLGVDADGNAYLLGESLDGRTWDVVSDADPPVYMPSEIGVGSSWKYEAHFASGNARSASYECTGAENMTTPAGTFETLKLRMTSSRTEPRGIDSTSDGYVWVSPTSPCAMPVKSEIDSTWNVHGVEHGLHSVETLQSLKLPRIDSGQR